MSSSYEHKTAVVTFDDAKTNVQSLMAATTNAGYPSALKDLDDGGLLRPKGERKSF